MKVRLVGSALRRVRAWGLVVGRVVVAAINTLYQLVGMSSSRIFIAWYPLNALCERGIAEKDATGNLQLTANGTLMRPFLSVTSIPPARQLSGGTSCRTPPTDLILPLPEANRLSGVVRRHGGR